jgi:hypothetical protein
MCVWVVWLGCGCVVCGVGVGVRAPSQDKSYSSVFELLRAVGGRLRSGLEQNNRTDPEKYALTPGTTGFTLQPIPREQSDHAVFSGG